MSKLLWAPLLIAVSAPAVVSVQNSAGLPLSSTTPLAGSSAMSQIAAAALQGTSLPNPADSSAQPGSQPSRASATASPMAPLAETASNDGIFATWASETGSQVYQTVFLKSRTTWPNIDNIIMNGGRAIVAKGTVEIATVGPVNITGAQSAFFSDDGWRIRDIAFSNIRITEAQREGIRLRGDVEDVTIRNFSIRMRAQPQTPPNLPGGIPIYNGRKILIEDGFISGFKMVPVDGEYTNGDGISSEEPVNELTIRRVTANDNSDAGFDLKSDNTFLYDTHAERNWRNYRFWRKATTGTIYSVDPGQAHVWVGDDAEVVIDKLIAKASQPVYILYLAPNARKVTIRSCELDVPAGTRFFKKGSKAQLILGPGCTDR